MTAFMDRTASAGLRDGFGVAAHMQSPPTSSDQSPSLCAQPYVATTPLDHTALQSQLCTPAVPPSQSGTELPDILDPTTAASSPIRHVCCIGAGYVGGPTAAVLALHNPEIRVTVIDRDSRRIDAWKGRHLPIHEPGLTAVVRAARDGQPGGDRRNIETARHDSVTSHDAAMHEPSRQPNLFFTTDCAKTISEADIILISVNTPTKRRGQGAGRATDMTAFEAAIRDVANHAQDGCIIVEKSTVPCKTGQLIKDVMEEHRPGADFPVLSNPEFLSEGTAVKDLMSPDRVIIGCESTKSGHRAASALVNLYAAWVPRERIAPISIWSSELCKLTANAMLAQRISSINSISAMCERIGADVGEVAKSVGMDKRIGSQFLKAGLGFGGSCFRKDIASLTYLAESLGLPEVATYWQQVLIMNDFQRDRYARNVISKLNNSLRRKKITILGYAFKKNTGDARESPALDVIRVLLEESPASIAIYDPLCSEADIKRELRSLEHQGPVLKPAGPVQIVSDPHTACEESNALLILTDWDMFKYAGPAQQTSCGDALTLTVNVKPLSPTDVLQLKQRPGDEGLVGNRRPPTPPASPKPSLHDDLSHRLNPEPACHEDCTECAALKCQTPQDHGAQTEMNATLDWPAISHTVKEPKWIFDGRGILGARPMAGLGFRLETIGCASP